MGSNLISVQLSATILLFLQVSLLTSQETCTLQDNGEILCESGYVSDVPDNWSEKIALAKLKAEPDTGLEFLEDDAKLEFDEEVFLGNNAFLEIPALEVVRKFIRSVKGLSGEKLEYEFIGSGEGDKVAWVFFPYRLAKLAKVEVQIYNALKKFFSSGRHKLFPLAQSYLRDVEKSSIFATSNMVEIQKVDGVDDPYLYIATHPILVYRMIRRFVEDLQPLLAQLQDHQDLMFSIYNANPDLEVFPNHEDLEDALLSLLRIQVGHNLKTEDFAKGILANTDTQLGFNALHCLEIGVFMIKEKRYDYALQWIYLAWEAISTSPKAHEFNIIYNFYLKVLSYALTEHNNKWLTKKNDKWSPGVFTEQVANGTFNPKGYTRLYDKLRSEAIKPDNRKVPKWDWPVPINFESVCSGDNLQTAEERKDLSCFYYTKPHPYWLIGPLKLELLNFDPPAVQIHDFIEEEYITAIKRDAVAGLRRSTVVDVKSASNTVVDITRTSAQVWLYDTREETKYLERLSRKMEFLSELHVLPEEACDAYQVAAYGTSHHYAPHIDSFENIQRAELKGNRILTIMGYLSDVAVGGRTGFPIFGVAAEPVKGSVVMWQSMMGDMISRDMRSYHGGCPVVLGLKWITNKWIYSKENMFKYQCLSKDL